MALSIPFQGGSIPNPITLPAGANGAGASIRFANDDDTGIWSVAAGNISISTNNTERFRFGSGGDILLLTAATALAMGGAVPDVAYARLAAGVARVRAGINGTDRHYMGGGAAVASATALPVPTGNVFHVTGTTNITSMTSTGLGSGVVVTLIFDGVLTFTDGNNLKLAGNFVTAADSTITLVYDGTNFYEIARSTN